MNDIPDTEHSIQPTTIGKLRRVLKSLTNRPDDTELSFEYMMTAFFPKVYRNVMDYGKDCYMKGYLAREAELKDENQGTN